MKRVIIIVIAFLYPLWGAVATGAIVSLLPESVHMLLFALSAFLFLVMFSVLLGQFELSTIKLFIFGLLYFCVSSMAYSIFIWSSVYYFMNRLH
jgi:hypothetical protein